jgi:glycosyltransferase involved in cell wall biosynthesis
MPSLTIVRVMPFFDPATQFGGVISQARETSRRLAELGHKVLVVTTDNGQPAATPRDAWLEKDGYQIYYASTHVLHRTAPYWTPSIAKPLHEVLPSADVLQLNVGLTLTNALARKLARRYAVPYVYNAEGALCPVRLNLRKWSKKLFLLLVERRVLRDAAALQSVTSQESQDLLSQGVPEKRVHLIPNGVAPRTQAAAPSNNSRKRFGIPATASLIVFVGRIHRIKGLDLLLDAIAKPTDVKPWLLVAGPDEDGSQPGLEAQAISLGIQDRVIFAGIQNGEDKDAIYACADMFALTSHTEGLPNAILEACSHGLPCLVTTPCNIPEVAEHGAGLVVDCDVAAIQAALTTMLSDPDSRKSMGAAAKRLIEEKFSLNLVVGKLSDLYHFLYASKS